MYENLKKYVLDNDYIISIMDNKVHIYNYKSINIINDKNIEITFNNRIVNITGDGLLLKKMDKKELLVSGCIYDMKLR